MTVPRGFHPFNDVIADCADLPASAARFRSIHLHRPSPSVVVRQLSENPMQRYRRSPTHSCVRNPQECVSPRRVWKFLKDRHPQYTDKNTAQELSEATGEDISYRTVERWRRRLPSSRHLMLMLAAWPDFLRVTAEEISASEARHHRLQGALEELEVTSSKTRNECSEDDCGEP